MLFRISAAAAAAGWCIAASAQTVGFATLPPGSILHAQASVIAKVVQDNSKLQVRVIGYGGDAPSSMRSTTQKADFLLLDVGEPAEARVGEGNWKGQAKPNLRNAMTLYGFQMAFWVKKDSPVKSIADLKGKKVPSEWVQQTSVIVHMNACSAPAAFRYNDVVKVPEVNVVRAADDFKSGKLDLLFFAVGAPKVQEVAAAVGGLRILPADAVPGAEQRMKNIRPGVFLLHREPGAAHRRRGQAHAGADHRLRHWRRHAREGRRGEGVRARRCARTRKALVEGHPNFNAFQPDNAGKVAAAPAVPPRRHPVLQGSRYLERVAPGLSSQPC